MPSTNLVWKIIGTATALVTAILPVYVSIDLWQRGQTPPKRVEIDRDEPVSPLRDLKSLGAQANFQLSIAGQSTNNLYIARARFVNKGQVPIVPSDFVEPLRVSVKPPWSILAVANSGERWNVTLKWKRVDEFTYEAEPTLLNPGDSAGGLVYLTRSASASDSISRNDIQWSARVVNLQYLEDRPTVYDRYVENESRKWGIQIELFGWSAIFVLCTSALFFGAYLCLLSRSKLLTDWSGRSIRVVPKACLIMNYAL